MVGLGQLRVRPELLDQPVVGSSLAISQPGVEGDQESDGGNRNVIRRRHDVPELFPVHSDPHLETRGSCLPARFSSPALSPTRAAPAPAPRCLRLFSLARSAPPAELSES